MPGKTASWTGSNGLPSDRCLSDMRTQRSMGKADLMEAWWSAALIPALTGGA
jgi:hypothetical protein